MKLPGVGHRERGDATSVPLSPFTANAWTFGWWPRPRWFPMFRGGGSGADERDRYLSPPLAARRPSRPSSSLVCRKRLEKGEPRRAIKGEVCGITTPVAASAPPAE
jgi:hypothetical protein